MIKRLIDVTQLNGIQANKPNLAMAAIKQEQTEEQVDRHETARAYASALTYREQARLLDDNQKGSTMNSYHLKLRLEKGVAQPLDVDRMEVTQRNLRSQYTAAQASYEIAVDQLKKVIGMLLDQPARTGGYRVDHGGPALLQRLRLPSLTTCAPTNTANNHSCSTAST